MIEGLERGKRVRIEPQEPSEAAVFTLCANLSRKAA